MQFAKLFRFTSLSLNIHVNPSTQQLHRLFVNDAIRTQIIP
jgi:hypothetical protein